ncbi:hypothetical protein EIN_073940, partial [Entamoeba invadens IP1]
IAVAYSLSMIYSMIIDMCVNKYSCLIWKDLIGTSQKVATTLIKVPKEFVGKKFINIHFFLKENHVKCIGIWTPTLDGFNLIVKQNTILGPSDSVFCIVSLNEVETLQERVDESSCESTSYDRDKSESYSSSNDDLETTCVRKIQLPEHTLASRVNEVDFIEMSPAISTNPSRSSSPTKIEVPL